MNTLNSKENNVLSNINIIAETICGNKYFVFADLVGFDLDNSKEELRVIVDSLVKKGYLTAFHDFDKTFRLVK